MKKLLLVGSQALAGLSFFAANAQADPVGAALVAVLGATAVNLVLAFLLTMPAYGGSGEFNGGFSAAKLGNFLKEDYATSRCLVLAVSLLGAAFSSGLVQEGFGALFVAGAAAQAAAIASDNAGKAAAIVATLAGRRAAPLQ